MAVFEAIILIVEEEPCTMLDFSGAEQYARGASQGG